MNPRAKLIIGIVAILAIAAGVLIMLFSSGNAGLFLHKTSTPTRHPTATTTTTLTITETATPAITTSGTPSPSPTSTATAFRAGDLGWGQISGTVVDKLTGDPVAGAEVICQQSSYFPQSLCDGQTVTAADGTFQFDQVFFHDTDTITLEVHASGYLPQTVRTSFFIQPGMSIKFGLAQAATPTGTGTPMAVCTPPPCALGTSEAYTCTSGTCPGGCGTTCATYTPKP
jgi:hypothetical protein